MAEPDKPAPELNTTEARGGSRTKANSYVLVGGLALVLIAFIVVYMLFG